jgi:diacylglycerol kinase
MENNDRSYLKNKTLFQSFQNAFSGAYRAFLSEVNIRIHLCAALIVVISGAILKIDLVRWAVLTLTIGLVLISELLNTSIEKLTDMVTTEYSDQARNVKDIAAAAVLISAGISVIVGILVFYRPVMDFIK